MKKQIILIIFQIICFTKIFAGETFRFVLFTDLHIQMTNLQPDESGDLASLKKAKIILDKLNIPYYITVGNHETKWSESGATDFIKVFGNDKFSFNHKGYKFIGFATGPIIKMGDGHIAPQDIDWVETKLKLTGTSTPVIIVTHYPLLNGDVDNWYNMTDVLRKYNVQTILNGHYHRNAFLNYDGIPGIVNRSTLKDNDSNGGYSIYSISDSIHVFEKKIGQIEKLWLSIPVEQKQYESPDLSLRPSYELNKKYKNVRNIWRIDTRVGIYTTAAIQNKMVFYGDDFGIFHGILLKTGKSVWKFKTGSRIISSPATSMNRVVFASTDGNIYCLDTKTGTEVWRFETSKAVLGCPLIQNDSVFIGGSDGCFRAFNLNTGKVLWTYDQLKNYVETRPVISNNKIMFGAWDTNFYALNIKNGNVAWKWNNGRSAMHFSPAAVLPVVSANKVFFTAPDRFWTALDIETGKEFWRTKQHEVRETIGMSEDRKTVYSRCLNDSVVAIDAVANKPEIIWKTNAGFGYDHNPGMLIEKGGKIIFGTKNGLLLGINAKNGKVLWQHKIGNSIINTISPVSKNECIITTTEGVVARIKY